MLRFCLETGLSPVFLDVPCRESLQTRVIVWVREVLPSAFAALQWPIWKGKKAHRTDSCDAPKQFSTNILIVS